MSAPWFNLPGDPMVSVIVTCLAKLVGVLLIYMVILGFIRFYIRGTSAVASASRMVAGIGAGVPFAAWMTKIFGSHFDVLSRDQSFETFVLLFFVGITVVLANFVNRFEPPSPGRTPP